MGLERKEKSAAGGSGNPCRGIQIFSRVQRRGVEIRSTRQVGGHCRASEGSGISVKEFEGPGRLNSGKRQVIE